MSVTFTQKNDSIGPIRVRPRQVFTYTLSATQWDGKVEFRVGKAPWTDYVISATETANQAAGLYKNDTPNSVWVRLQCTSFGTQNQGNITVASTVANDGIARKLSLEDGSLVTGRNKELLKADEDGLVTFGGSVTVGGTFSPGTTAFTSAVTFQSNINVSGNIAITGTLQATGLATLSGGVALPPTQAVVEVAAITSTAFASTTQYTFPTSITAGRVLIGILGKLNFTVTSTEGTGIEIRGSDGDTYATFAGFASGLQATIASLRLPDFHTTAESLTLAVIGGTGGRNMAATAGVCTIKVLSLSLT